MNTPTPPPGVVREFVSPVARRAHGLKVKDTSGSLVFMVLGFVFVMAKNGVIGFDFKMALLVTIFTLIVKGFLGYRYRRVRAPVLRQFRHGVRRTIARAVVYACLQCVSFSVVMGALSLYGHDIPGGLLRAVGISFASSLFFGELVGWAIDKISPYLQPYVEYVNKRLEPVRSRVNAIMGRIDPYLRPLTRAYTSVHERTRSLVRKVFV